ncbi:MAG: 50S ribosomal protein L22 [Pygmaiobacter massiliensis]|jgi:large subunit ribosomal protein L22|nr:50S ribosomal protein L22 [Pygmaiobacter massiliensis]
MEARAKLSYARISPRKVSIVLDLIRNKPLDEALAILQYTPKAASELLYKLVKSAAANAQTNHNMDKNSLYVAECFVTPGPTLKRVMPRAQGRAYRILKRTSHITVVLKEKEM